MDEVVTEPDNFHIPTSLPNVHSMISILSSMVGTHYWSFPQHPSAETAASRDLHLHGMFPPHISPVHSIIYSEAGNYMTVPNLPPVTEKNGNTWIGLAIPHPGAMSILRIGQRFALVTTSSNGTLIILFPHLWLVSFGFVTGQCREYSDVYEPRRWDKDGHDGQGNNFPSLVR